MTMNIATGISVKILHIYNIKKTNLALKASIRAAAGDKFCNIFPNFQINKV